MGKLKLAVVGETRYADRLAECIQKNAPEYLEAANCKDMGELAEFLEEMQPDILLCEQEAAVKSAGEKLPEQTVKILLADGSAKDMDGLPVIFRYQQGAEILRQTFQIYERTSKKNLAYWHKTEDLQMSAVYAPGGHELQLPFSIAYASICGEEGKVLYLNLAEFSGMLPLLGEEEGENFSDFIYGIRGIRLKEEKFPLLLQSVLHHAQAFDYVQPPGSPEDLYEICEEDLEILLSLLREQTEYKLVVWNCGTLNQLAGQVLEHCSKVFCVVKENSFGKCRKAEFERFLEKEGGQKLRQKVRYVSPQTGNGGFVQGVDILTQLESGEFAEQVRKLTQEKE